MKQSKQWIERLPSDDVSVFTRTTRTIAQLVTAETEQALEAILSADFHLSSIALQLANQQHTSSKPPFNTVHQAITTLNVQTVQTIALAAAFIQPSLTSHTHTASITETIHGLYCASAISELYQDDHRFSDTLVFATALLNRFGHCMYWGAGHDSSDQASEQELQQARDQLKANLINQYALNPNHPDQVEKQVLGLSLDTLSQNVMSAEALLPFLDILIEPNYRLRLAMISRTIPSATHDEAMETTELEKIAAQLSVSINKLDEITHRAAVNTQSILSNFETFLSHHFFSNTVGAHNDTNAQLSPPSQWNGFPNIIDFLSHVGHEVRTPMNGILGMADALTQTSLTQEQKEYVHIIRLTGSDLIEMINDILNFAKGNYSTNADEFTEIEQTRLCIADLLERSAKLYSQTSPDHTVWMILHFDDLTHRPVLGDATKLNQIFNNIISNAVKFTHSGHIFISAQTGIVDDQTGQFVIKIIDTGVGIAAESQAKIFDQFSQANPDTSQKFGGTGLGLSIAKQLIERMGGTIAVHSQSGMGAEFEIRLTLPMADATFNADKNKNQVRSHSHDVENTIVVYDPTHELFPITSDPADIPSGFVYIHSTKAIHPHLEETLNVGCTMVVIGNADINNYLPDIYHFRQRYQPKATIGLFPSRFALPENIFDRVIVNRVVSFASIARMVSNETSKENLAHSIAAPETINSAMISTATNNHQYHALFAEDSISNQLAMKAMLNKLGCAVTIVDDGQQCLEEYIQQPDAFDVIFVDIEMPQLNGLECAVAIRAHEQRQQLPPIPIYSVSGHTMPDTISHSNTYGINGHLTKPVGLSGFRDILESMDKDTTDRDAVEID